jgi:hypothetical protein
LLEILPIAAHVVEFKLSEKIAALRELSLNDFTGIRRPRMDGELPWLRDRGDPSRIIIETGKNRFASGRIDSWRKL